MRLRCRPQSPKRHRYYGRGIRVCPEWNDWDTFADFALANGWREGLTIDRIDNDKGYFPGNVRFVTRLVNTRNRDHARLQSIMKVVGRKNSLRSPKCRPVVAVSPGGATRKFLVAADAARFFKIPNDSTIYAVLSGQTHGNKYLRGWTVRYAT
jgi:hypothetical protein